MLFLVILYIFEIIPSVLDFVYAAYAVALGDVPCSVSTRNSLQRPKGIFKWNLNQIIVHLFRLTTLAFLEQWLKLSIKKAHI